VTFRDSVRRLLLPSHGTRLESLVRLTTAGVLLGFAVALLVGAFWRFRSTGPDFDLIARQPSAGGWSRERIVVNQGERVRLRIRSEDVVHGFAIGRMGVEAGPIEPGKVTTVEFVADRAGEFTFYCTMWCDPNHARMRGILEVRGPGQVPPSPQMPASDVTLQHLDDPRDAGVVSRATPSATHGLPLYGQRCASCHGERGEGTPRVAAIGRRELLLDLRPVEVFRMLAGAKTSQGSSQGDAHGGDASMIPKAIPHHAQYARDWNEQERWNVVAALWSFGSTADRLDLGQRLYLKNCAACHGERGTGDGPGGKSQPKKPVDFTDARRMLAGSTALYTAKIRRGGMGTGMPYWGSIFTEEELAALVDYLWTFSLAHRD
jgi:cytochrome c oxidase subunit II